MESWNWSDILSNFISAIGGGFLAIAGEILFFKKSNRKNEDRIELERFLALDKRIDDIDLKVKGLETFKTVIDKTLIKLDGKLDDLNCVDHMVQLNTMKEKITVIENNYNKLQDTIISNFQNLTEHHDKNAQTLFEKISGIRETIAEQRTDIKNIKEDMNSIKQIINKN